MAWEKYGRFPCDDCWLSQDFKSSHRANDYGWLVKYGANRPVKAWKSGTVLGTGTDSAGGVYVIIKHIDDDKKIWISRYWHFVKGSVKVKKGQTVKQGQTLGTRGNSGISTGVHLHFEIWKTGKTSYTYKSADRSKYAVNPRNYCYIFDGQHISVTGAKKKPTETTSEPTEVEQLKAEIETLKTDITKLNGTIAELNVKVTDYQSKITQIKNVIE